MWNRIRYLAMPVPRYLRDMGYVRGLKRLDARGRRCEAAWAPHVAHSRSLILEAADRCGRSGKALVLGSGPLFDVPVKELSERFREVVLVDLLHLWRARSEARRYPNVRLECMDVTGVLEEAHALTRIGQALEGTERTPDFFLEDGFDLIVSANILSQLPLAPVRYASRKRNRAEPWRVRAFSRRLAIDHLDWLASFLGHVCLISDLERLFCDGEDVVSRGESLWGIALPEGGREWMWELGPKPEIDPRHDVRHRVVGYVEFPKEVWLGRERAGEVSV